MSQTTAERETTSSAEETARCHWRFLEPGEAVLVGIMAAGAAFVLAAWVFAHYLSGALAEVQLRHRAQDIAGEVAALLAEARWDGRAAPDHDTAVALRHLVRFSRIRRLDLAAGDGRVVWSSVDRPVAGRIAAPREGRPLFSRAAAMTEDAAAAPRLQAIVPLATRGATSTARFSGLVAVEMDTAEVIAWYRRIGYLFAKAVTVVIMAALLVTGLLLLRRMRERHQAEAELARLRRQNEQEHRRVEALQLQLVRLQEELARLNRRLAGAMRDSAAATAARRSARDGATDDDDDEGNEGAAAV